MSSVVSQRIEGSALTGSPAPGSLVWARDEQWRVTGVEQTPDGYLIRAVGVSDFVRDLPGCFYTAVEQVDVFDPLDVRPVFDASSNMRDTRVFVETHLRQTPVPSTQNRLAVSTRCLADPLDYQHDAVMQALTATIRPRVLLADAVGLGKTLEIGMMLAELIRRGRGARILVVTPLHVIEQFQQELWTRFAIPLVRLDTAGIRKIRQKLPASRNPFTYYPRVIASIDTLKSPKYLSLLDQARWDCVVIDEIHNAVNRGTQNNTLARRLSPTTEALILASATPHNGNPESFKELLSLLDPLAVRPDGTINREVMSELIIRRHRSSETVANVVGPKWAKRLDPVNILVEASPSENAVATEIVTNWIGPDAPPRDDLFAWTLVKAFLSSPAAFTDTVHNRLRRVQATGPEAASERAALQRLLDLADTDPQASAKFGCLVDYLKQIGVGGDSPTRVVVFSERIATLMWLQKHLPAALDLDDNQVAVMHGGLPEETQLDLIDTFKQKHSQLRILVTGDIASEGINLHAHCHDLVHFDIPWSLIRIQQRNGRIDRYGQTEPPQIAALLLDTTADLPSDVHVLRLLIEREHEAYEVLGDASPLMGSYSGRREEETIRAALASGRDIATLIRTPADIAAADSSSMDDLLAQFAAGNLSLDTTPPPAEPDPAPGTAAVGSDTSHIDSLYDTEVDYLEDALRVALPTDPQRPTAVGGVDYRRTDPQVAAFTPPPDLQARFDLLPSDYLRERHVTDRLTLAVTPAAGDASLAEARNSGTETTWPAAHFLSPLHPATAWAGEKALASRGLRDIPVVIGDVDLPTVVLMGLLANQLGQTISRAILTAGPFGLTAQPSLATYLRSVGVPSANPGAVSIDPEEIRALVREAAADADAVMRELRDAAQTQVAGRIEKWQQRAAQWIADAEKERSTPELQSRLEQIRRIGAHVEALRPQHEPSVIRPLLVIIPREEA